MLAGAINEPPTRNRHRKHTIAEFRSQRVGLTGYLRMIKPLPKRIERVFGAFRKTDQDCDKEIPEASAGEVYLRDEQDQFAMNYHATTNSKSLLIKINLDCRYKQVPGLYGSSKPSSASHSVSVINVSDFNLLDALCA